MQQNPLRQPHPLWRLSTLAIAICTTFSPVQAQQQQKTDAATAKTERIEVTGSRIRRTDMETHTPVVSVSSDDIARTGAVNINQLLNQLPAMVPALSAQTSNNNGYAGTSTQDLRGLGSIRTLVLVNGRRHVPTIPGTSTVDVSSIPTQLIERIDILTGGASSVYGADAVSGVVNIILKKQFDGTELLAGYSQSGMQDGERGYLSLTHGEEIDDGSLIYHLNYHNSQAVEGRDRPYVANDLAYVVNPDKNGTPKYLTRKFVAIYNNDYRAFVLGDRAYRQDAAGATQSLLPAGSRISDAMDYSLAGVNLNEHYGNFYTRYQWARLMVPDEKLGLNLLYQQELQHELKLSADVKYSLTNSESRWSPPQEAGVRRLPLNYQYYNKEQQTEVAKTGQGLFFAGHFPELGRGGSDNRFDLFQTVLALEGTVADDYRWQLSAQHGQTKLKTTTVNDINEEHWQLALWGSYTDPQTYETRTCGTGCVSANVFQPLSAEAVKYIQLADHTATDKMRQTVLNASIDGDLFELPAGSAAFAAGLEHRREKSDSQPSDVQLTGLGGRNYRAKPQIGQFHVSEAFAELRLPLFSDLPVVQQLDWHNAWRTARYNLAGTNHSWTTGLDWTLFDGVKLRASRAKAVRAPNITENFQPDSEMWNYVYEVCYPAYQGRGSQYRPENCKKAGLASPPNYYNDALIKTSGNQQLAVERAYTFTGGLVWSPQFVEQLNLTVDYWDINLQDKIGTLPWDQVYPNCMDGSSLDSVFCQLIERKPGYMQLNLTYLNLARHKTRGVDYALDYRLPLDGYTLKFNSNWGRLLERELQSDPAAKPLRTVGGMSFPQWRGTNTVELALDDWQLALTGRYLGPQKPNPQRKAAEYDVVSTKRLWYVDVSLNYQLSAATSLTLTVDNLLDRNTPQVPDASTGGASWEMGYSAGLFDTVGSYYGLHLRHRF